MGGLGLQWLEGELWFLARDWGQVMGWELWVLTTRPVVSDKGPSPSVLRIATKMQSSETRETVFPVCAPCVYTYPVSCVAIIGPTSLSGSKFLVKIWENHHLGHLDICCLPSSQHRSWWLVLVCSGNECELISDGFWKEPIKGVNQQNSNALSQMPLFSEDSIISTPCAKFTPSLLLLTLPAPAFFPGLSHRFLLSLLVSASFCFCPFFNMSPNSRIIFLNSKCDH